MVTKFKRHKYYNVIFITTAILYFSTLFCSIANPEIQILATTNFSNHPGFDVVLNSGNDGRFFEMEAALCILLNKVLNQNIIGFDLEIAFYPGIVEFNLGQEKAFLHTTEFDIVTTDFVIECKNSAFARNGKSIAQFIKEKNSLAWIRWVAHKIKRNRISITHDPKHRHSNKTFFLLSHFSKKPKSNLSLSCNWIVGGDSESRVESFKRIILMLAEKKLIVFFRNHANQEFTQSLIENKINFMENIRLF